MSMHPKSVLDLALAPVAAQIDLNLQRLREKSPAEIESQLSLELEVPVRWGNASTRRGDVLTFAIRNVDLNQWRPVITEDCSAVRLSGGSVTLDIALGRAVSDFLQKVPNEPEAVRP